MASNSRWNAIGFAVSLVSNFLTIPIAIAAIGLEAFGAAGLVLALYAPCSLVGTVLGQAVVRELSPRVAQASERHACRAFLWTATWQAFLGSCVVALVMWLAGRQAIGMLSSGSAEARDWIPALAVGFVAWFAQQLSLLLQALLASVQAYSRLAVSNSLGALSSAALVIGACSLLPGEVGFLAGTAGGFLVLCLALAISLPPQFRWLLRPGLLTRSASAQLMRFTRWQGLGHLSGATANQVDRYALGSLTPLGVVGQYNVAMRLQEVVHMGLLKVTEVLYPHFSLTAAHGLASRARFYVRASWVMNVLGVSALAPLIPLADSVISLWVGESAAEYGGVMLMTLAMAGVLGCGTNVFTYMAMATERVHRLAQLNVLHALLVIALTFPLIMTLGAIAAGLAYVIGNAFRLAGSCLIVRRQFPAEIGLDALAGSTIAPILGGLMAGWLIWWFGWFGVASWPALVIAYLGLALATACMAIAASLFSSEGRSLSRLAWGWLRGLLPKDQGAS